MHTSVRTYMLRWFDTAVLSISSWPLLTEVHDVGIPVINPRVLPSTSLRSSSSRKNSSKPCTSNLFVQARRKPRERYPVAAITAVEPSRHRNGGAKGGRCGGCTRGSLGFGGDEGGMGTVSLSLISQDGDTRQSMSASSILALVALPWNFKVMGETVKHWRC